MCVVASFFYGGKIQDGRDLCKSINCYYFSTEMKQIHDFVSTVGFSDIPDVTRTYFRHCVVGKFQDGRHLCKVKLYIDIFFDRIEADSRVRCRP